MGSYLILSRALTSALYCARMLHSSCPIVPTHVHYLERYPPTYVPTRCLPFYPTFLESCLTVAQS